jgi:hypothetical protein
MGVPARAGAEVMRGKKGAKAPAHHPPKHPPKSHDDDVPSHLLIDRCVHDEPLRQVCPYCQADWIMAPVYKGEVRQKKRGYRRWW